METNNTRKRPSSSNHEKDAKAKMDKRDELSEVFSSVKKCKVLNELKDKKVVFVQGKVGTQETDAVLILEKKPFDSTENGLQKWFTADTKLDLILQNDIYSSFSAVPPEDLNQVKVTFIHPATQKHIEKYKRQKHFLVEETADLYTTVTLPHLLDKDQFSVNWVDNILDKKCESERIVFEDEDKDDGFILLPDMKWDGKSETLYLIGFTSYPEVEYYYSAVCIKHCTGRTITTLPHKKGLRSLRDLNEAHLPLLKNILQKGKDAILSKYNVEGSNLLIYLHYQPSYYHLHVHFTHNSFDAPGTIVSRAHLLTDVIENITMKSDYYQIKTLTYSLRESDALLDKLLHAKKVG